MSDPVRVVFAGAAGRMGSVLCPALEAAEGVELVGRVEVDDDLAATVAQTGAEVVVDFTAPASALANARAALEAGAHAVVGTTGLSAADLDTLGGVADARERAVLVAPNFSLGMLLLQRFAEEAVRHFPRVEIVETHHEGKADAPSGTALSTAERLAAAGATGGPAGAEARGLDVGGVRVHSLRLEGVEARQSVHFGGDGEELVLRHQATSRRCYVPGVLAAVRGVRGRRGLLRGLEALLFQAR